MKAHKAMNGKELLNLAERLRAGDPLSTEDRDFLAGELERMATEKRGPGRPKRSPLERALRKLTRRVVADEIFHGIFPKSLYPSELALSVEQAKGKRTEADDVAATILGKGNGVRSIQMARERHNRPTSQDEFQEAKALLVLYGKSLIRK